MKITVSKEIDLHKYGLVHIVEYEEIQKLLSGLYEHIYIEACYDPWSEDTMKFAKRLYPDIVRLNKILRFKK